MAWSLQFQSFSNTLHDNTLLWYYYDVFIEPVVLVRVINHKVCLAHLRLFLARRLCMLLSCCHMINFCLIIVTRNCNPFITYYYVFFIPTSSHHHHIIIKSLLQHYYIIGMSFSQMENHVIIEPLWLSNLLCN